MQLGNRNRPDPHPSVAERLPSGQTQQIERQAERIFQHDARFERMEQHMKEHDARFERLGQVVR